MVKGVHESIATEILLADYSVSDSLLQTDDHTRVEVSDPAGERKKYINASYIEVG